MDCILCDAFDATQFLLQEVHSALVSDSHIYNKQCKITFGGGTGRFK